PLMVSQFAARAGADRENGGGVGDAVNASELQDGMAEGSGEAFGGAKIRGDVRDGFGRGELRDFVRNFLCGVRIHVGDYDVRATVREHEGDLTADATAATYD